jgi:hypothetical protein
MLLRISLPISYFRTTTLQFLKELLQITNPDFALEYRIQLPAVGALPPLKR